MPRIPDRQISFADAEMKAQGIVLDKIMQGISDLIDRTPALVQRVYQNLVRGLKRPQTGRDGLNAEQTLRSFILQRVKNWDLRELRERIADGLTLRIFTAFHSRPVPSHHSFHRAFSRLTPETMRDLNEAVVKAAVALGLEDGEKLRLDTTVVETDIHFPTDGTLLWDGVRVITRLVKRLREKLPQLSGSFPDRTRRAKRRSQQISRLTGKSRPRQQVRKYRDLIRITEEVLEKAGRLAAQAKKVKGLDPFTAGVVETLVGQIAEFRRLGERVVAQTRRRVLQGEQLPVQDKVFSIFEPHTDLIMRGKVRTPVEFGHKVLLVESGQGLITDYQILKGNPADQDHVKPVLAQHQQCFGAPPKLLAGDRGFYSEDNVAACKQAQVTSECLPQRGGSKTPEREAHEKSRAFKAGQRFRAGIEGRISVLFRGRGMKRCLCESLERFETFVGIAVLANNLLVLAALINKKRARRRRAA